MHRFKIFAALLFGTIALAVPSASAAEPRDRLVGSGGQSCRKAKQTFDAIDLERDQNLSMLRASAEATASPGTLEATIKKLSGPVLAKHKMMTSSFRSQLREFALGMLQGELLKANADPMLLELENFDYPSKFLDLCREGNSGHDELYHTFVTQVLSGQHKVQWLRTTR